MEQLVKDFKKEKSEKTLDDILAHMKANEVPEYLPSLSDLISQILSTTGSEEKKFEILTYIIDLFFNTKFPQDQLQSIGLERIFNTDYPLYKTDNSKALNDFFNYYFPNQELIASLSDKPTQVDFLWGLAQKDINGLSWFRGSVIKNTASQYSIIQDETNKEFFVSECLFQPYGSMTDDHDWRKEIKQGDEIDFLDNSKTWYLTTVLGRDKDIVKIGLRVYRENGNSIDEEGKKFFGWSSKFDVECSVYCGRIQKPGTFSREIINNVSQNYPIDSKGYNSFQVIAPKKRKDIFVIPKMIDGEIGGDVKKIYNLLYIRIANYFYQKLNFEKAISENGPDYVSQLCTLDTFDYFTILNEMIYLTNEKLTLTFAKPFIKTYIKIAFDVLIKFSQTETRKFKKVTLESTIKEIKAIMEIIYFEYDIFAQFAETGINFGLNCLKNSTILEKQLLGMSSIDNVLSGCIKNQDQVQGEILLTKEPNILTVLFESNNHSQIIQKSYDLVKELFQMKIIKEENLVQLYKYAKATTDQETEAVLYKILGCFPSLSSDLIAMLAKMIMSGDQSKLNSNDIELLINVAKATPKFEYRLTAEKVLGFLYEIIQSGKEYNGIDLPKMFYSVIKADDDANNIKDYYLIYINQIMNDIKPSNIEISFNILNNLLTNVPTSVDEQFRAQVNSILFIEHHIFDVAIQYLNEGKFNSDFFHFITYLIEKTERTDLLTEDIIKHLFEIFNGKLIEHRKPFISWMKDLQLNGTIIPSQFEFLFEMSNQYTISTDLFDFYWCLFLSINKMIKIEKGNGTSEGLIEKRYTGVTSDGKQLMSYSYSPKANASGPANIDSIIYSGDIKTYNPFGLKYFDLIWNLLIKLPEADAKEKITKLFGLFLGDQVTSSQRNSYWNELISRTIDEISKNEDNSTQENVDVCKNCLSILNALIEESEKKGTAGCVSHSASLKSFDITLNIKNSISPKIEKEFNITVKSNMTIWDFKKEVAQKINVSPECIKMTIYSSVDLNDTDNGKLVNKKFMNNMTITVSKNPKLEDIPKVILISNGVFTPKAQEVFREIFDTFSTNGKMSKEQCTEFVKVAVDSYDVITVDDSRIKYLYDKYDVDKDGFITSDDFTQFFFDSIEVDKKLSVVWENIKAFGYRNDLKKLNEPIDNYNNDGDYFIMPRYVISNEQKYFEPLFNLQSCKDQKVATQANELINMICTNSKIYNMVLEQGEEWEKTMNEENNKFKIYYLLQIVEALLENRKDEKSKAWADEYLKKGFEVFLEKKFFPYELDIKNEDNSKIYWCMCQIVLTSLQILSKMEFFEDMFNVNTEKKEEKKEEKDKKEEKKEEKKEPVKEEIQEIKIEEMQQVDGNKYKIVNIMTKIFNTISSINQEIAAQNKTTTSLQEDIEKKCITIFALLSINLDGKIISSSFNEDNLKEFIYQEMLYSNEYTIQKHFMQYIYEVYKKVSDQQFKSVIESALENKLFDKEFLKKYKTMYFFNLYQKIITLKKLTSEEYIHIIKEILKFKTDNFFTNYFEILNSCIEPLSKEEKITLCKEDNLLHIVVCNYLLEDTSNKEIYDKSSDNIYNIISNLISGNKELLLDFFSLDKIKNINSYTTSLKENKDNYEPISESRCILLDYIGLYNLRNICYMNSILQQFFNIASFRFGILNARDNVEPLPDENIKDDNLLHQLQRMFTFLQLSKRGDFAPTDFVYSFKDLDNKPTDINVQCDASEFLSRFMEKVEFMLKKTKYKYLMKGIFNGETCSQLICKNGCGSIKNRFEELIFLSLDIKNVSTLKESLEKYISEEVIDDFYCEACQKKAKHIKRISINKLPNVLIVHLQRISFNYETFLMEKINSKLEFPKELNMKPYCTEEINANIPPELVEYHNKVYNHSEEYYEYKLKGVVVHSGTAQYGHYYSFINTEMSRPNNDRWLRFNDSMVQKYNINSLVEDTFGGSSKGNAAAAGNDWFSGGGYEWEDSSKSAYILVYERKMKTPILLLKEPSENAIDIGDNLDVFLKEMDPFKEDASEEKKQFLDCEDTAMSRKSEGMNEEKLYKFKDEFFSFVSYYKNTKDNVQYYEEYHNEVISDNIIFRNDMNIYRISFVKMIAKLAEEIKAQIESLSDEELSSMVSELNSIILTIITKSSFKGEVSSIIPVMIDIITTRPNLAIIVLDSFLNNKNRWMFSLIVTLDNKINSFFSTYLAETLKLVINKIDSSSEIYIQAMNVIEYLYSLMPNEISKNWTKMVTYLDIFETLCKSNTSKIISMMMERDTIKTMGDFFLVKESPFYIKGQSRNDVGNKTVNAKFAPLIGTLSLLVRHCPNLVGKKSPLYIECEDNKEVSYELSEDAKIILNCNEFYKKAIKDNYHNVALSKLLAHLMYEDFEFTSKTIFYILDNIENAKDINEIKETFNLLFNVAKIKDSFTQNRLENLFGVPMINFKGDQYDLNSNPFIKYISPLFPMKTSIIERIQSRWKGSPEWITIASYLYGLIFSSEDVFRYFNSLPHPRNNGGKLSDYIKELCLKEIDHLKSVNLESKFEKPMELVQKCLSKYEEQEKTFKEKYMSNPENGTQTWEISFLPKTILKEIKTETVVNIPIEEANNEGVYLLKCDLDVEVSDHLKPETKEGESPYKKEEDKSPYQVYPVKQDTELKLFQDKIRFNADEPAEAIGSNIPPPPTEDISSSYYMLLFEKEHKVVGDIDNMIEMRKEEEDKGEKTNEYVRTFIKKIVERKNIENKKEEKKESKTYEDKKIEERINKVKDFLQDTDKSKIEKQEEEEMIKSAQIPLKEEEKKEEEIKPVEEIPKVKEEEKKEEAKPIEEVKPLSPSETTEPITKTEEDKEVKSEMILRRYIICNTSNNDYRCVLKITSDTLPYCPVSELIVYVRKKTFTQVITLPLSEVKDDTIIMNITEFDMSNIEAYAQPYSYIKKSKSVEETKKTDELKKGEEKGRNSVGEGKGPLMPNVEEDPAFEVICPMCSKKNTISGTETVFKCSFCESMLFD